MTQRNLEDFDMRISMEGKDKLSDSDLDSLVNKFKNKKDRYIMLYFVYYCPSSFQIHILSIKFPNLGLETIPNTASKKPCRFLVLNATFNNISVIS